MAAVVSKLISVFGPVLATVSITGRRVDTRWIDARLPRMINEEGGKQAVRVFRRA
jgi:hypothetical protein